MSLIRLVYASRSRLVEANRSEEVGRMIASAQRLNVQNEVTGFLLVTPGAFAQVLEGEAHNVAETYGRIVVDPRHTGIRLLAEEQIAARSFQNWSMGLAEHDETTHFIFGLYGVTPEADLQVQPADVLLDLAGELARQRA
ncbi:BLUF domain-containing protein [Bosea sp. 2YAB26]|uniref:BLUF domain-containing protein n=1 Tax=unclassified Bosea (in: a-proteobacteria) TaxID=2653178 RepID=UPI003F9219D6